MPPVTRTIVSLTNVVKVDLVDDHFGGSNDTSEGDDGSNDVNGNSGGDDGDNGGAVDESAGNHHYHYHYPPNVCF
jgi:hypothetical protein